MIKYIIIEKNLLDAQMKGALKGYSNDLTGKYIQDSEETMRDDLQFKNDNKTYCVLSWDDDLGKPAGVLPRYSENGNNPKVNKIMSLTEIKNYININVEPTVI